MTVRHGSNVTEMDRKWPKSDRQNSSAVALLRDVRRVLGAWPVSCFSQSMDARRRVGSAGGSVAAAASRCR